MTATQPGPHSPEPAAAPGDAERFRPDHASPTAAMDHQPASMPRRSEPVMTSREHAERTLDTHVENLIGSCGRCYSDTGWVTPAPCPARRAARRYLDTLGPS